ncbi:hypothetical protein Y032_0046g1362 [Ancylostoma ceylanicum]|uniref:BTB domain-containing protein n=1 Tax=Ancylostoma ceylanicum TaxID=53326 RepID=A0A016UCL7_9BILA|nr:hypothetical protein Y032_0046g1362 [Ancylostoma ceylanicum]
MTCNMEGQQPGYGERVKINVGGSTFETSLSTLTRLDGTVLSIMVADRWRGQGELFVDRDPTYFPMVLNYLRDGDNFIPPSDIDARENLRREAEVGTYEANLKRFTDCAQVVLLRTNLSILLLKTRHSNNLQCEPVLPKETSCSFITYLDS